MKELLKRISPILREMGFKGSGQNYYRLETDTISVVNFQKSSGGLRFYINLGVRPLVMVPESEDPKKSKEYDCIFRDRISPPNNAPGWSYQLTEAEIDDLREKIRMADVEFFNPLSQIREAIKAKSIDEMILESSEPSIFGGFHAATFRDFSEMALLYGEKDKSRQYAQKGIQICKPEAISLLADLKKLANT